MRIVLPAPSPTASVTHIRAILLASASQPKRWKTRAKAAIIRVDTILLGIRRQHPDVPNPLRLLRAHGKRAIQLLRRQEARRRCGVPPWGILHLLVWLSSEVKTSIVAGGRGGRNHTV
jgi:hypothetical protein